ncbi:MAG: DUF2975 domain-containing protein [Actinobacteria bacterium]|nr:DUF2975 domain-containing protein [Actinomycetota bacterium]
MSQVVIVLVRVFIVVLVLGTLAAQILLIPALAGELGALSALPAASVPYAIGGIALGLCLEVCLLATWMLLSMVRRDAIFSESAFRWVDAIIGAAVAAFALVALFGTHAVTVLQPRLEVPGIAPVVAATAVSEAIFVLLVVVLRGLLRSATNLRTELAEVI